ncbi:MAG: class I adenylate-forming enzyme family protein [Labedaea sp.]
MDTELSSPNYVLRALELFVGYAEREALVKDDQRLSFTDIHDNVLDLASALREQGIRPGMAVAVLISLPIEGLALQLALHLIGCRLVWVVLGTNPREMREYLALSRPDAFIYDPRTEDELGRELAEVLAPAPVLCLGPGGIGPDLLTMRAQRRQAAELAAGSPESVFSTSGTTGTPKALLHKDAMFQQTLVLAVEWRDSAHPRLRQLSVTPLWWAAGTVATLITLGSGGTVFIQADWSPDSFLRAVQEQRINFTFMSPPMFYELLDDPALPKTDCSSLYMLNVGAAPPSPQRLRQGAAVFGPVVRITYGLSESPYVCAQAGITDDPERPELLRSAGTPWGDVRLQIRAEDGTVLEPGATGEVWVHSRLNFAGYLGAPELTEQTLVNGWLRTRDIGYLDEAGRLFLVGRAQDMIITGQGSRKIYARPIEEALSSHPNVRAAAVIGVPDPDLVEVVHAYVVPGRDPAPDLDELRDVVTGSLPKICAPRSIDFVDSLPLVGIGKVDKKALRDRYAAEHIGVPG